MGSKDKYFGVNTADHGFDDIGTAQPTGSFSGATLATQFGPRFAGKTKIVITPTSALKTGQTVNLTSTDAYLSAKTTVLKVLEGGTQVIVNRTWQTPTAGTAGTGTYDTLGGEGAWDAFMPIGTGVNATGVAMTFWKSGAQGSNEDAAVGVFSQDKVYHFPDTIKTILISTGNIRLFRSATRRPGGLTAQ